MVFVLETVNVIVPLETVGVNVGLTKELLLKIPLPTGLAVHEKPEFVFTYPEEDASDIVYELPAQIDASAPAYTDAAVFIVIDKEVVELFPQAL